MTAQIGEILLIDNQQYIIAEQPLHHYFRKLNHPPYFTPPSPTCWRGYYGKWELRNDELFLINFRGYLDGLDEVELNYLFPKREEVFASWYSGIIKIPQGKLLQFNQLTHTSIYELRSNQSNASKLVGEFVLLFDLIILSNSPIFL